MLWNPAFFGVKPDLVLKGGHDRGRGDGRPECLDPDARARQLPADVRRASAALPATTSWTFVSAVSLRKATLPSQLDRSLLPVRGTRAIGKKDMALNDTLPSIEIDPERYTVTIDGERIVPQPARALPLTQRYFLF